MKKPLMVLLVVGLFISCKDDTKEKADTGSTLKKVSGHDSRAPKNEIEKNIYRSADEMINAFKTRDWKTFAKYNHPAMLKMMGGKETFESMMTEQMKQIPDSSIKKLGINRILQVVTTPADMQCVVEQNMTMQLQGMEVSALTYLVGESLDAGKTWSFFDASNGGTISPKSIKPNISAEITIPQKKQDIKKL